jgi:hypothetical protein
MKKLVLTLMICSFLAATSVLGQQWNGSSNTNGSIGRNGNVGIGLAAPQSLLHLYGYAPPIITLQHYQAGSYTISQNNNYLDIDFNLTSPSASGKAIRIGQLPGEYTVSIDMKQKTNFSSSAIFQTQATFQGQATFNNTVKINTSHFHSNGKVSIGTANTQPDQNLDGGNYLLFVKGGTLSEEVTVRSGWADYVFGNDYHLLPLEKVEQHIETYGHLHNTPSAADLNGMVNLGDAAVQQQEKIEEIYLHLIEMNKEVKALRTENERLKQEIEALK